MKPDTPTPETLQQMMERWRKLAAERNPQSPYLSDQLAAYWLVWCAAELAALLDTAPPAMTREQAARIRCGDIVRHRPTGETWVVAYADYERDELAWQGWPDGFARLSDCELIESCTDDEHARRVREVAYANIGNRSTAARRLYGHVLPTEQETPR